MALFKRTPKHLKTGVCRTARELNEYWATLSDRTAMRDAGLSFLATVGQQLVGTWAYAPEIPEYLGRYPGVVQWVSGELAQVEADIQQLVDQDKYLFDEAFAKNLAEGFRSEHRGMHPIGYEVVLERASAIDAYFGDYISPARMVNVVQFAFVAMKQFLYIHIDEQDERSWVRAFELAKLFASKRPAGGLTQQELLWLDNAVRGTMSLTGRELSSTHIIPENNERGARLVSLLRPSLASASA